MTEEEIIKAFNIFKSRTIRAWCLDTEDSFTDRDRKSTRDAHIAADAAEAEFRAILRYLTNAP